MSNREVNINNPVKGLNLDTYPNYLDAKTAYTAALNLRQESFDGNQFNLTNEESNTLSVSLETNRVIGVKNIPEIDKSILFLVDEISGTSTIGYIVNSLSGKLNNFVEIAGQYVSNTPLQSVQIIVQDDCLEFDINFPIHEIDYKISKHGVEIYWTDGRIPKYMNIDKPPLLSSGDLDCNKIKIFPNFQIPEIDVISVGNNGSLVAGSYQFFGAYSNSKSEEISQYYAATNPTPIYDVIYTNNLSYNTTKSINVRISRLDTTFNYFNLVVGKTVDNVTTYHLIGTFDITGVDFDYLYTGEDQTLRNLSREEVYFRIIPYSSVGTQTVQGNRLIYGDLTTDEVVNYQSIASKITPKWISYRIPYNEYEGYNNPVNVVDYRSFMRDEVYTLELVPIVRNGFTNKFHIPGRISNIGDKDLITNNDVKSKLENPCDDIPTGLERWKVYNTASVTGYFDEWLNSNDKACYKGPYQYGEFSYWESTDVYPNNTDLWGELAGEYIRHHKFPDELVSPRFSVEGDNEFIYPVGVYVDPKEVLKLIQESDLTQEQKDNIIGFKIIRGNRSNNSSIVAKGLMNNVGSYEDPYTEQEFYYANYPYNDLRRDPFFAERTPATDFGLQYGLSLNGFEKEEAKENFIFYSPDTLFQSQPITAGLNLKVESVDYGISQGHFVPELNNAKHKLLGSDAIKTSILIGVNMAVDYSKQGVPQFNGSDAVAMIGSMRNLFENLAPWTNYGYSFHSKGEYNNSYAVPNNGNKIRFIDYGRNVTEGLNGLNNGKSLNHFSRESGVFINTNLNIPFTHQYSSVIPQDKSRYILSTYINSDLDVELTDEEFFNLCKSQDNTALTYLGLGIVSAMAYEYSDDSNLLQMISVIGTATLSNYIGNLTYQDLLELEKLENFNEDDLSTNYPDYDIAFPGTKTYNSQSPYEDFLQYGNAYKAETNNRVDEESTKENIKLPPIGFVDPRSTFLFYYNSSDLNPERDDCEGQEALNFWPPLDENSDVWNNGPFEWGPIYRLRRLWDYECDASVIFQAGNVRSVTGRFTGSLEAEEPWPWGAGTFSAGTLPDIQLRTFHGTKLITWGNYLYQVYQGFISAKNLYQAHQSGSNELTLEDLETIREASISSYYVSIKRDVPNQWGQIDSYQSIDTGHTQFFDDTETNFVFGGDVFINKFALKIKNPIYTQSLVDQPDGAELFYNRLGNYGHPMFWISSEPVKYDYRLNYNDLAKGWAGIGLVNKNLLTGNVLSNVASAILTIGSGVVGLIFAASGGILTPALAIAEAIIIIVAGALYLIGWIFTHKGNRIVKSTFKVFRQLLQQMMDNLERKNINLDLDNKNVPQGANSMTRSGAHYLYVYGIPNFFVESDINVDYRHAENTTDKNFYPNVGNSIPDNWLMETNVPIITDNYYQYNPVYSKQNSYGVFRGLPRDWDPLHPYEDFPTRVIYSEQSNQEEIENNWTIFKVNNYKDFDLTSGKLVALDSLEENKVLARFENNTFIFNAYTKLETSTGTSIIGTGSMFESEPQQYSNTSLGYMGSQHKAFISTKHGYYFVDAKRGEVFNIKNGGGFEEISRLGLKNWFKENLPFQITKYVDVPTDNSYKDIGISLVWDNRYERLFLTKKDYRLKESVTINDICYKSNGEIDFNSDCFEDVSWTMSYSPNTQSWVSYHSFTPNYYIEQQGFFQSGINSSTSSIWDHNCSNKSYQIYYNELYPFEFEVITQSSIPSKTIQSIQYRQEIRSYTDSVNYRTLNSVSFDKAEVYNNDQTSGVLNLSIIDPTELYSNIQSVVNPDSITIGLSNKDDIFKFNRFYNIVSDDTEPIHLYNTSNTVKFVNSNSVDYSKVNDLFNSERIKSDYCRVKLSNTKEFKYKYIFKWLINKTITSVR